MILEVIVLDKAVWKFKALMDKKARRLVTALAGRADFLVKKGSIEIYLIDDRRMRRLNRQFRGKDKPTNVLSFVKPKGFPGETLGEVYLGPVYIQKNKESLDLMLVHGVLHILGFDHKKKNDRIVMEKKESQLIKVIS